MSPRVLVCYRAETSAAVGNLIFNMLVSHFDSAAVIRETEDSGKGENPPVPEPVDGDVVVVILHPHWLRFTPGSGASLADWDKDFIFHRYMNGLIRPRIHTIVVLSDGAAMPSRLQLPSNLQYLPNYDITSLNVTQTTFDQDANRLLHIIRTRTAKPRRDVWPFVMVGILLLAAVGCFALVPFGKISLAIEGVIPGRVDGYVYDAWHEYQNGSYDNAIAKFEHANQIHPSADAYEGLAWSYVKLEQPEAAVANFEQLITFSAGTDRGYGQRGWYYIGEKDYQNALTDMENAIQVNPKNPDNYYGLGMAQDGLGNFPAALEAYNQYLSLTSTPDSFVVGRVQELEQANP